jgi:hypothetical protein
MFFAGALPAQKTMSLNDVIHRARLQSPSIKAAETARETRYWQYRFL